MSKKTYKPGQIADQKLLLQELNTNGNPTKKEFVDVNKGDKVPPTAKKNYTYESL
jgi:hypothetical protein